MQLSFAHKEHFFHSFSQMLRSGIPAPQAMEQLGRGRDRVARAARVVAQGISTDVSGAFRSARFSTLDVEILAAGEQSGRLEEASERLSEYYATLAKARRDVIKRSIYPIFIVHLAALLLSIPRAVLAKDGAVYAISVAQVLIPLYLAAIVGFLAVWGLLRVVRHSVLVEQVLRGIPLVGALYQTAVLSRFCLVLSLGIRSADGVLASLKRAGRASLSAEVLRATTEAVAKIKAGESFTDALAHRRVFPNDLERSFRVAELSGRLDEEMTRSAEQFRSRFFALMDALAEWIPRLLYLLAVVAVGIQIFLTIQKVGGAVSEVLEPF